MASCNKKVFSEDNGAIISNVSVEFSSNDCREQFFAAAQNWQRGDDFITDVLDTFDFQLLRHHLWLTRCVRVDKSEGEANIFRWQLKQRIPAKSCQHVSKWQEWTEECEIVAMLRQAGVASDDDNSLADIMRVPKLMSILTYVTVRFQSLKWLSNEKAVLKHYLDFSGWWNCSTGEMVEVASLCWQAVENDHAAPAIVDGRQIPPNLMKNLLSTISQQHKTVVPSNCESLLYHLNRPAWQAAFKQTDDKYDHVVLFSSSDNNTLLHKFAAIDQFVRMDRFIKG